MITAEQIEHIINSKLTPFLGKTFTPRNRTTDKTYNKKDSDRHINK